MWGQFFSQREKRKIPSVNHRLYSRLNSVYAKFSKETIETKIAYFNMLRNNASKVGTGGEVCSVIFFDEYHLLQPFLFILFGMEKRLLLLTFLKRNLLSNVSSIKQDVLKLNANECGPNRRFYGDNKFVDYQVKSSSYLPDIASSFFKKISFQKLRVFGVVKPYRDTFQYLIFRLYFSVAEQKSCWYYVGIFIQYIHFSCRTQNISVDKSLLKLFFFHKYVSSVPRWNTIS